MSEKKTYHFSKEGTGRAPSPKGREERDIHLIAMEAIAHLIDAVTDETTLEAAIDEGEDAIKALEAARLRTHSPEVEDLREQLRETESRGWQREEREEVGPSEAWVRKMADLADEHGPVTAGGHMRTEHGRRLEDDGRTDCERWRAAAIQAKDDLRAIEAAFREATPVGEDDPNPPIGPGHVFAQWTSPANTMRWIEEMERQEGDDEAT